MDPCPSCGVELETALGCHACGELLEVADHGDPFVLLGLEPAFDLGQKELRKRLVRHSRLVHPDFFSGAEPALRDRAEHNSAALNEAFGVLSDDFRRADWLVRARGAPDEAAERSMPQAFLMEVMEWNEQLEEARAEPSSEAREDLSRLHIALQEEREALFETVAADLAADSAEPETLTRMRRTLNAVRYIDRALGEIEALRLDFASAD